MMPATLAHDEYPAVENSLKYQLTVVASSVLEAVTTSGGWLFDRVMAGWEVNVLLPDPDDVRPLSILGARAFALETTLAESQGHEPQGLAVSAQMFARDERIGRQVRTALRRGDTEVTFWGAELPAGVGYRAVVVEHQLTAAAHAFKNRALALAAAPAAGRTERFFVGGAGYSGL
ncbi:hypothetical protein MCHIJ_10240 [Mycolicibacterium chitae]|nr:hypothetical protein MCHIJ_10240 [Mycolicibacterium chitae]